MARITGFRLKDGVYQANVVHNGKSEWRAVMSQNGQLYVRTGSKLTGDLVRHNFSDRLADRFERFVCTGKDVPIKSSGTCDLIGEDIDLITGRSKSL